MFFYDSRAAIIFFLPFILLASLVAAYPIDADGLLQPRGGSPQRPSNLQLRRCPTTQSIAEYLRSKHPTWNGENTVFYSKPASAHSASVLAGIKRGRFYGSLVTNNMILHFVDMCGPGREQDLIIPRISEAIALLSTGTAYVITDPAQPPSARSIWMVNEFPTLKRNNRVRKIIQHDYATGKERQIWP